MRCRNGLPTCRHGQWAGCPICAEIRAAEEAARAPLLQQIADAWSKLTGWDAVRITNGSHEVSKDPVAALVAAARAEEREKCGGFLSWDERYHANYSIDKLTEEFARLVEPWEADHIVFQGRLKCLILEAEQRGREKEREAHVGNLINFAAECHRNKWEFSSPDPETDPPIKCAEARLLVERAFEVLHALGNKIMAAESAVRARGERKEPG